MFEYTGPEKPAEMPELWLLPGLLLLFSVLSAAPTCLVFFEVFTELLLDPGLIWKGSEGQHCKLKQKWST